jgi:hypothetical protein
LEELKDHLVEEYNASQKLFRQVVATFDHLHAQKVAGKEQCRELLNSLMHMSANFNRARTLRELLWLAGAISLEQQQAMAKREESWAAHIVARKNLFRCLCWQDCAKTDMTTSPKRVLNGLHGAVGRRTLTFGVMPSFKEFSAAFDAQVGRGERFVIRAPRVHRAGRSYYAGEYDVVDLYALVKSIKDDFSEPEDLSGASVASAIIGVLGFEWI